MQIPPPSRGSDILPWAVAVTRALNPPFAPACGLARSGLFGDGAEPLPANQRNRTADAAAPLPFAVNVVSVPAENEGDEPTLSASIYLPQDSLFFDGAYVPFADPQSASEDDGQNTPSGDGQAAPGLWRTVPGFSAASSSLWINISFSGETSPTPSASISLDSADASAAISIKIASFSDGAVTQLIAGALALSSPSSPDAVSIALYSAAQDDAQSASGDDARSVLGLKDFASDDSDSARGLAERLSADPDTGQISANGAGGISLVARRDGKILYIPLSADGADPDDRDADAAPGNPCEHPGGGNGGVSPGDSHDSDGSSSPGSQTGQSSGVPAGGQPHIGDSNCNC